ncbi:MAG: GNAT family N-acetyltransferase [Alphaproteobacteria bacterium]|nr:GNAT family N-acetyltransferase [Alphaproteobacteria bacterium]MBU0859058.1 GNAT family N-acetyltransferase [Alphaproteobacteria bacterium]
MGISQMNIDTVKVRLARNSDEIAAAQRLRYKVFYEEYAAKADADTLANRRDSDAFDAITDHLIVLDESNEDPETRIVGTYRLLRREAAEKHGAFYTSGEYDINPLLHSDATLLELGRSCVLAEYRTRPVLQLLWQGITDYMLDHNIDLMFGCASLHGTDIKALTRQLSYLHHYHLAPAELRPRALDGRYVEMDLMPREDLDPRRDFASLPPLIKGYLRLGAGIGHGAVIDEQFDTTDVCIVMPMREVSTRYRKHYERKVNRPIPSDEAAGDATDVKFAQRGEPEKMRGTP